MSRITKGKTNKIKKFNSKMQANLLLVFCVVILLFSGLIGRILFLNYKDGDEYSKRVLSQQTYVSNAIPYKRGDIVDRNMTVMAKSVKVYNLILDPKLILQKDKFRNPTITALTKCFDLSKSDIDTILEKKSTMQYVVVLKELDFKQVSQFQKLQKADKKGYIKGVWFEEEYVRRYPMKTVACDVLGFTTKGNVGNWGIEQFYNEDLNGANGREYGYFDSDLKLERTVKPAVNGNTIVSTIDANVQKIVEKKIADFEEEMGAKNVAVLVMNPNNGEIYAMASNPVYDLNNPTDLTPFYTKEEIDKMSEKDTTDAWNAIWRNFTISDTFEPGSTFKPVTVSAALDEAKVTNNSSYVCDGSQNVSGVDIGCSHTHGTISLGEAISLSCNDALMQIGAKIGYSFFLKYQTDLGFGGKTGIDLPGESTGITFNKDTLGPVELATSTFGQGENVTMIQLASAFSAIINGGNYYQPHVVKQILNDNGATVKTMEGNLVKKVVTSHTSDLLRKYMEQTVLNGTGTSAKVDGYSIGGKTGTAEKDGRDKTNYLVSFIGFTPVEKPEVVVYVVIDEPNVANQAQSSIPSKLTGEIMKEILPFLGVYPSEVDIDETNQTDTNKEEDTTIEDATIEDLTEEGKKEEDKTEEEKTENDTNGQDSGREDTTKQNKQEN